jgi:sugar lactone lactonase YvrE
MTTVPDLLTRRALLRNGALATGALALGPAFWKQALAAPATPGESPYGPLAATPDANGFRLPQGFTSRVVARANEVVPGTTYRLPTFPDGQATYGLADGGWILATNSETPNFEGGVSAIRFDASGAPQAAYRILTNTSTNCSGGPTPWGTWLSCEETDRGAVWECDPTKASQGVRRPALGLFKHEAVAVDSVGQRLYLTEDNSDGGFYRFTPELYPVLDRGLLEVAVVAADGSVTWVPVPNPQPGSGDPLTKDQVPQMTQFKRGEGIWFDSGVVYVATTSDNKVHAYDTVAQRIDVIYDRASHPDSPLSGVDNMTVSPSGDLFICEDNGADGGTLDIGMITPDDVVSRFCSVQGPEHVFPGALPAPADVIPSSSELTGPIFDPSGTRLYVCSQRSRRAGVGPPSGAIYEITGPFRLVRPAAGPTSPGNTRTTEQAQREAREAGQAVGSGQARSLSGAPLLGSLLGVEVPRRVPLSAARRSGIPVMLTLTRGETVSVSARARFRPARRRGVRRSRALRRRTLGSVSRSFASSGPQRIDMRMSRSASALLRGRRQQLRVDVEVRVGGASLTRSVLLTPR